MMSQGQQHHQPSCLTGHVTYKSVYLSPGQQPPCGENSQHTNRNKWMEIMMMMMSICPGPARLATGCDAAARVAHDPVS